MSAGERSSAPSSTPPHPVLVGREQELQTLAAHLDAAAAGSARTVIVRGAAGAGKSALLDAVVAGAADRFQVVRASGHPAETGLPYAVVHQLLGRLPSAQATASVPSPTAGVDPLRNAGALLARLAGVAAERPLLIVVDDMQWTDAASRRALVFISRRLDADAVCLLFAVRAGEPVVDDELGRIGRTLEVGPLHRQAALALLADAYPELTSVAAARIIENAAGNPLALRELTAALTPEQRRGRAALPRDLPVGSSLEALYRERLDALSASERRALLALCFDPLDAEARLRVIARLGGTVHDLDAAERAGLVVLDHDAARFRQATVPLAVRRHATRSERARVHAALAEELRDHPVRHAFHLQRADGADPRTLADALVRAAAASERTGADAEAGALWEEAAALGAQRRDRLWSATGAYLRAGAAPQAERTLAALAADPADDAERAALAAQSVALSLWTRSVPPPDADDLLTLADRVAASDLVIALATAAFAAGRYADAHRICAESVDISDAAEPLEHRLFADVAALQVGAEGAGRLLRSEWIAEYPWARVREPGAPTGFIAIMLAWMGDDARLERALDACRAVLEAEGPTVVGAYILGSLTASLEVLRGRWDRAAHEFAAVTRLVLDSDFAAPHPFLVLRHAHLLAARGDVDGCEALLEEARTRTPLWTRTMEHLDRAVRGHLALLQRDFAAASAHLAEVRAIETETGALISGYLSAFPDEFEAAWHLGDADALLPEIARYEASAAAVDHATMRALAARCRGLLADDPDPWFTRAIDLLRDEAAGYETGRTRLLWGMRLRRARRKADAHDQLRRAEDIFARLGAASLLAQCRSELAACGVRRTAFADAPASPVAGLTPREFEVAREVAAGATNAEAARRLFISERTVEFHLSRVFRKLGVDRRTELPDILAG